MSTPININGTPRSSTTSATLSPTWRPPKSPLPPHRLAKLANALGVSTPIPANHNNASTSFLSRSFSESSGPIDQLRRSPTPSTATSSMGFNSHLSSTSRYLLHVIPPIYLPHNSDDLEEADMTPPPASASGYHTQFRRGILVPVYPTLQSQLGAIAKEYALPSTAGMILYLVSSGQSIKTPNNSSSTSFSDDEVHDPGPRLSDDVWKHLWTRVLQAEQHDGNSLLPSRSATPAMLTIGIASRSTSFLPQEDTSPLRPLLSISPVAPQPSYSFIASPSTSSSMSDMRSNSKSAPPSSISLSDPGTPDTSVEESVMQANSFDLPGLNSPSLIPILAKVEFDIDRRKASWYEPWLRSRKANHAKRAESRASRKSSNAGDKSENEQEKERVHQIPFLMRKEDTTSPRSLLKAELNDEQDDDAREEGTQAAGYQPLEDTQDRDEDLNLEDEEDVDFAEDSTARVSSVLEKGDPLEDIFGSDADNWAAQKNERRATHEFNPHIVELPLTGADLAAISFTSLDESRITSIEEREVRALLDDMTSSLSNPEFLPSAFSDFQSKKHIPPPLVLAPKTMINNLLAADPSPLPNSGASGTNLPYLGGESPDKFSDQELVDEDGYDDYTPRSPNESEKRSGTVFDDLDLGLDPSDDFDDDDPNDRRRSQYVMKAQLDEIERTLAQLSPRILKNDLAEEQNASFHSATLSPHSPSKLILSPGKNFDFFPPSPRLPQHPDPPESQLDPYDSASWPAVPFSLIKDGPAPANKPPSPPRVAVNGVTTTAPRPFTHSGDGDMSMETSQRKRELEEEHALYPPIRQNSTESPVIPLSPDPFGRFSSTTPEIPSSSSQSAAQWDTVTVGIGSILGDDKPSPPRGRARSGTTSRFSADSFTEEEPPVAAPSLKTSNRGTLISVRSIKNLWRKSNHRGSSQQSSSAPSSGRVSPAMPQRPERPSQETLDLPDVPPIPQSATFGRFSPQIPPSRTSQDQLYMPQRPSLDAVRPSPSHSARSSQEQLNFPQQRRPSQELIMPPQRRSQDLPPPPPQQHQQLSVPYGNRGHPGNTSPVIPAQMLSSRPGANLDRLHFDQESPYPIRRSPPVRYARPPSPPQLPPIPEKEKIARKSILKWKSVTSNSQVQESPSSSFEHLNGHISRGGGRRPSLNTFSPDLPPSPRIPEYFLNGKGSGLQDHRQSVRSRLTNSSIDSTSPRQYQHSLGRSVSPPRSSISSRDSQERRPSIDSTQFEIVSPKVASGLSYPYHGLDS